MESKPFYNLINSFQNSNFNEILKKEDQYLNNKKFLTQVILKYIDLDIFRKK